MFVMLDDSAVISRRLLPLDRVGRTLHLAAVARGGDAGNSKPQTIALSGNDLKPYAPVHLTASGSFGADITLTWVRPTRVGGDLRDGFGTVLLAEDAEEYELEILGPDDDVRRTVTGLTSATLTYTAAMQAEDFPEGYPASAFVVYQISAQVGRLCWPARLPGRLRPTRSWRNATPRSAARCSRRPLTSAAAAAACSSAFMPMMRASQALASPPARSGPSLRPRAGIGRPSCPQM
jgi:hypothetical protein